MIVVKGKCSIAHIHTDNVEDSTLSQITDLCNNECSRGSIIHVMPDCHTGNGCVIGTTMTIKDTVVPNLVGVDVACVDITAKLQELVTDFAAYDHQVRRSIPAGFNSRKTIHPFAKEIDLSGLKCADKIDRLDHAPYQIGTLGGGNHFHSIEQSSTGEQYAVIHSGSRGIGKKVAEYYQNLAIFECRNTKVSQRQNIIQECNNIGRLQDIGNMLSSISPLVEDLAYLEGASFDDYMHDMEILRQYANLNRAAMIDELVNHAGISVSESFETVHNYVDGQSKDVILRKGAISAQKGEKVVIPLNMRDGSIIAVGKGNSDWNYSAPHGAGRVMGRREAKRTFKLEAFQEAMEGIYSTSVSQDTIDESPFVYKPASDIVDNISDTVEICEIIKPVYNFKAS
jgi:RNA-splicing ligase RtcB